MKGDSLRIKDHEALRHVLCHLSEAIRALSIENPRLARLHLEDIQKDLVAKHPPCHPRPKKKKKPKK